MATKTVASKPVVASRTFTKTTTVTLDLPATRGAGVPMVAVKGKVVSVNGYMLDGRLHGAITVRLAETKKNAAALRLAAKYIKDTMDGREITITCR